MLKRIAAAFLSAGALLGSALCVNAAEADTKDAANMAIKLGDADNNGAINAVDASIILSNYARYSTSPDKPSDYELITQDVNSDSLVNAIDASIVLSYYAYTSIGGTFTLPEYLKNPNEAPTEPVTTTTTTTTTTTQTTTEPATYEYTLENITQSAEVFNYFAEQMNRKIFGGRSITTTNFDGVRYDYNGKMESKVALWLLNEHANFNDSVLQEIFKDCDDVIIREGVYYFYMAPAFKELCGGHIDFNEYSINKNVGDYMNMLEIARENGDSTGDYSEMNNIIGNLLYNGQYGYAADNAASLYYTLGTGAYCSGSEYEGACIDFANFGSFDGIQAEKENKIKALIK